jgi:hypothetical protein
MSTNGNGNGKNRKDKDQSIGEMTGDAIDTSVSWLDTMWDKHATKVVIIVLIVCVIWWFRKEVSDVVVGASEVVSDAVTGVGATAGQAVSGVGAVAGQAVSGLGATAGEVLTPQVGPAELGTGTVPSASEIRALFNF